MSPREKMVVSVSFDDCTLIISIIFEGVLMEEEIGQGEHLATGLHTFLWGLNQNPYLTFFGIPYPRFDSLTFNIQGVFSPQLPRTIIQPFCFVQHPQDFVRVFILAKLVHNHCPGG